MKKYICILLILTLSLGCKNESKKQKKNDATEANEEKSKAQNELITKLTLDETFETTDVRRYGVFPDKDLGTHPSTGNKKMDELLNLAGLGVKLTFPQGIYKTVLNLSNKKDIELNFDNAVFTGAILIYGAAENYAKNITLNGELISYNTLSISYADKIKIDRLIIRNNKDLNISGYNSTGCNIYTGTMSLYMNYLEIEGTGSDGDQYRYTPAALMIHGKVPVPNDILINQAIIKSSDRHGAYLSGKFIEIEKINIQSYAQGKIDNMIPIAYTVGGDEKKITGVWLNDFEDSRIEALQIDTSNSPKATDAIYLDSGDITFPSVISKAELKGNKITVRKAEATNVEISE